jgi:tight adherence protein C
MPDLTPSALMLLVGIATAGMAVLLLVDRSLSHRERVRLRLVQACSRNEGRGPAGRERRGVLGRGRNLLDLLAERLHMLPLLGARDQAKTRFLLTAAGFRNQASLGRYIALKFLAMLLGGLAGLGLVLEGVAAGRPILQSVLLCFMAFAAGLLPEAGLQAIRRRRQTAVRVSLADALDLMIIATNAGHSLDVALARVGRELEHMAPVLADEITVVTSELRGLPNRRQALENFATRTDLPEVRSLTATLIQTIRYGTPLSQALKALAIEMRQAKLLALEEHAARLPALLSLPLMLLIMPAIFIVTAAPAVIRIGSALFR